MHRLRVTFPGPVRLQIKTSDARSDQSSLTGDLWFGVHYAGRFVVSVRKLERYLFKAPDLTGFEVCLRCGIYRVRSTPSDLVVWCGVCRILYLVSVLLQLKAYVGTSTPKLERVRPALPIVHGAPATDAAPAS